MKCPTHIYHTVQPPDGSNIRIDLINVLENEDCFADADFVNMCKRSGEREKQIELKTFDFHIHCVQTHRLFFLKTTRRYFFAHAFAGQNESCYAATASASYFYVEKMSLKMFIHISCGIGSFSLLFILSFFLAYFVGGRRVSHKPRTTLSFQNS